MKSLSQEIKTISLLLPFRMGSVNCYLINVGNGYILIDTGSSNRCKELERVLESIGCTPGNLKLIIITHGDFDHTGNAAYIRRKFHTKIAMHYDDLGMVERGDMFWNRKKGNIIVRMMINILYGFGKSKRFKPDFYIEDGYDFSEYGLNAKALHIPGHSKGSIAILTGDGNLICGDLLVNSDKINRPKINTIMDDLETANMSIGKLVRLEVNKVYPGHGKPFQMEAFLKSNR